MKKANSSFCTLHLKKIELELHLGWTEAERLKKQTILIDVKLLFSHPPTACISDNLKDTYCYDTVIQKMISHFQTQSYCLIEHVAAEIYKLISHLLPNIDGVQVFLTKNPQSYIPQLTDGVTFFYGDEF